MGFFDSIKSKIFGAPKGASAAVPPQSATPAAAPNAAEQAALNAGKAAADKAIADALAANKGARVDVASADNANYAPGTSGTAPASNVDVSAILDEAVAKSGQKLNWKTSIVDLMKALDIDSSLTARKELADELGYTGDKNDSATMNIWLHKQVLQKLAENGGNVPASLLD
jgi:hypothetical protein